jgi:[acyl-carrier-protein] S-malonyltransferase
MIRVGVVFPGQGAQYVGMGKDLCEGSAAAGRVFREAGRLLEMDVADLCFQGPQERLSLTVFTQIAVLTVDIACWEALREAAPMTPEVMAGHSLGEYAALYAAGAVTLDDVFPLVKARAEYHQRAVPVGVGAMAAIVGLTRERVDAICREASSPGTVVALALQNSSNQLVVSGHTPAVDAAVEMAATAGALQAVRLPISVPCHSRLLDPTAALLAERLRSVTFEDTAVPVIPNCDPEVFYTRDRATALLTRQITSPVRWQETVEKMVALGVDTVIEVGPGRVLSGLSKRIHRGLKLLNVEDAASLKKTADFLNS